MSFWNRLWVIGRKNDNNHLRFYPNPGLCVTLAGWRFKWSKFYGLNIKRVR